MTAHSPASAPATPGSVSTARPALDGVRLRTGGIVASEVLKLTTVRSTWWSIGVSVVLALALALVLGASFTTNDPQSVIGIDPAGLLASGSTVHLQFVGLVIAVLGALSIGGEYSTGMIRSTYTAVPRRLPSLLARGAVVALASFAVGLVTCFGSYVIIAPMLEPKGIEASLVDDGILVSLIGGAFYLAVVGAFAVGLAAMLRSTAAAIGIAVGVLFVLPIITSITGSLLRAEWIDEASRYLLSNLGSTLASLPGEGALDAPVAIVTALGWVAAVWIPALLVTRLRDV